jgi:hypothetical protein
MTAIFYPDCEAHSDNGRFKLEAQSPHIEKMAPYWLDSDEREAEFLRR